MKKKYHRQRFYGKPLPSKRQVQAHLKLFETIAGENKSGYNNLIESKRSNISYTVAGGRISKQKRKATTRSKSR